MYIRNRIRAKNSTLGHTREDRMGGGLRPFGNNSLRSSLQKMLDPVMCGSSDAVPVEFILYAVFYAESRHAVLRTGDCALGRALVS